MKVDGLEKWTVALGAGGSSPYTSRPLIVSDVTPNSPNML